MSSAMFSVKSSERANSISQFDKLLLSLNFQDFEICSSEMVKNTPDISEENIEICCSEMTKNPLKNFHQNCRKSFEILQHSEITIFKIFLN